MGGRMDEVSGCGWRRCDGRMDGWTEWTGAWREGWGVGLVWDNGQDRRVVSGRRHGGQGQLGRWKEGAGAAGGAGGKVEQVRASESEAQLRSPSRRVRGGGVGRAHLSCPGWVCPVPPQGDSQEKPLREELGRGAVRPSPPFAPRGGPLSSSPIPILFDPL